MSLSNGYCMRISKDFELVCGGISFLFMLLNLLDQLISSFWNLDLHVTHRTLLLYGATSIKKILNHLHQCLVYFPSFFFIHFEKMLNQIYVIQLPSSLKEMKISRK